MAINSPTGLNILAQGRAQRRPGNACLFATVALGGFNDSKNSV